MSSPDKRKKHPETREGEIFLCNITPSGFNQSKWKTKRKGEIAYDSHGKDISSTGLYPIFVSRQELIDNGQDPDSFV